MLKGVEYVGIASSIFSFTIDPYGLVEMTGASRYGGGNVEPGARLIFHNLTGAYDFSSKSDQIVVRNKGECPLRITVKAVLSNMGDSQKADIEVPIEQCEPVLYLSLIDNKNHESLIGDRMTTIVYELPAKGDLDEIPEYSFGLIGECNPDVDWGNMDINMTITVTWSVESIPLSEISSIVEEPVKDAEAFDDTKSVKMAEPPEMTEFVKDTEPSDVTEPVENAEPSNDTQAVENVEASDVTESIEDAQPSDVAEPAEDTEPSDDTRPVADVEPFENTGPVEDAEPVEDTEPSDVVEPVEDTEPSDVAEPVENAEASEIAEPVEGAAESLQD